MFKTFLCIPPDYDHKFPPLGTPALTAFFKENGFDCIQSDLNLGYRDFLASKMESAGHLSREDRIEFLPPVLEKFFSTRLTGKYYSSFLPRESDGFFPHLPYGNNSNSSFYFCERMLSSPHLRRYLEDREENTFLQFFEERGVSREIADAGLVGISVTSPSQAVAALTLGSLIKKTLPGVHVNLGGQWVTLYRDAILKDEDLERCFDSIIVFEGESALLELARTLNSGKSAPRMIEGREEEMDLLPTPDFDGLPVERYDMAAAGSGGRALTYETSRGCYWSRCAYCVDLPLPKPRYRRKDPELVLRDFRELKKRWGAQYLFMGDPGMSPRQMREISRRLVDGKAGVEWWTMARLDPGFDAGLFRLARSAGLHQINFGFESACDRVCGLLDKGNRRELSSRVIRDCAQAGIRVDLQTIFGLPGESFEDGLETIDFLISHKDFISHVTVNTYYLTPSNHVHRSPERFGIEYDARPDMPFRFFIPFRNRNGLGTEQAYLLEKIYHSLMKRGREGAGAARHSGQFEISFSLNGESCAMRFDR
ncbi:MAG: B12-binding domain-containing radical SAM protein [Deltaproteobacteria bacterium]